MASQPIGNMANELLDGRKIYRVSSLPHLSFCIDIELFFLNPTRMAVSNSNKKINGTEKVVNNDISTTNEIGYKTRIYDQPSSLERNNLGCIQGLPKRITLSVIIFLSCQSKESSYPKWRHYPNKACHVTRCHDNNPAEKDSEKNMLPNNV